MKRRRFAQRMTELLTQQAKLYRDANFVEEVPDALDKFAKIASGEPWDSVGFPTERALEVMYGTVHDIRTYYEELACELADTLLAPGQPKSGSMIRLRLDKLSWRRGGNAQRQGRQLAVVRIGDGGSGMRSRRAPSARIVKTISEPKFR